MKLVKIIFLFILTYLAIVTYSAYAREFDLTKSDIYLGKISKMHGVAYEKIIVSRKKITPLQTNLLFQYDLITKICKNWGTERKVIPGHFEFICKMIEGEEVCQDEWIEEKITFEKVCEEYVNETNTVFKKIVLDFKSAADLHGMRSEEFEIDLKQEKITSGKFIISGRAISSDDPYEIFARSFLHKYQTLYFAKR